VRRPCVPMHWYILFTSCIIDHCASVTAAVASYVCDIQEHVSFSSRMPVAKLWSCWRLWLCVSVCLSVYFSPRSTGKISWSSRHHRGRHTGHGSRLAWCIDTVLNRSRSPSYQLSCRHGYARQLDCLEFLVNNCDVIVFMCRKCLCALSVACWFRQSSCEV